MDAYHIRRLDISDNYFITIIRRLVPFRVGREIRAAWRLSQLIWLLAWGFATIRFAFPRWSEDKRRTVKQAWSAKLLDALGVKPVICSAELPPGTLIVSNHISWLDVFVINAFTPSCFVCKNDVKSWPFIGKLVAYSGTMFIERGSRTAAARSAHAIAARLSAQERVAIFPEGTTTQGTSILPFQAALFQAALDAGVPVQPVALRYLDAHGEHCFAPAYSGDTGFGESLLAIARTSGLRAELHWLEILPPKHERRELTRQAESAISKALGMSLG
jgi:1-acyl-sn-glycerol-3-phosphate acyltransferase